MTLKLRNQLIGFGLLVLASLAVSLPFGLSYRYAHVASHRVMVPRPYPGAGQAVDGLAFSPDGKTLAVADTQMGTSLWSLPALRCRDRVSQSVSDGVSAIRWKPDGSALTLADSSQVYRWSVNQGRLLKLATIQMSFQRTIPKEEHWSFYQIHIVSPSGKLAAGANAEGDIVAWNIQTGQRLFSAEAAPPGKYGYTNNMCDIAFSPDDRFMAVSSFKGGEVTIPGPLEIVIWSVATGKIVRQWTWKEVDLLNIADTSGGDLGETGLVFSPSGSAIAAADMSRAAIWETKTGRLLKALSEVGSRVGSTKRLVFFRNGDLLAGCGWEERVPIWDVRTGKVVQTFYTDDFTEAIAVSPNDRWLATGGQSAKADGRIELWDISRLRQ